MADTEIALTESEIWDRIDVLRIWAEPIWNQGSLRMKSSLR